MSICIHIPGRLHIRFSCCLSYVFLGSLFFLSIHFVHVIWRRRLVVLSFGNEGLSVHDYPFFLLV